jgi:DNA polymerase-3 subunit gamma/tau
VHYQRALALLGATDVALIDEAVDALAAGDAAALFGAVESVIDAGHDPRRFATDLLERFRDLIVLQAVPDCANRGVVDAPGDVLENMRDQSTRIGPATLARYAEVVHAGLERCAVRPALCLLLLEVICARLLLPSASDTESALLQRVERIETRLDISIPVADAAPAPARPPKPPPRRDPPRPEPPAVTPPSEAPPPHAVDQPSRPHRANPTPLRPSAVCGRPSGTRSANAAVPPRSCWPVRWWRWRTARLF